MINRNQLILLLVFTLIFDLFVWRLIVFGKPNKNPEIYFLDIGQGDSELAILPGGVQILIDAGPNNKILSELSSVLRPTDRYIDLVILSHPQLDHFAGLIDVFKRYQVGAFIYNGRDGTAKAWPELLKIVEENKIPTVILAAGDKIHYRESKINFLSPDENFIKSKELNDTCLVALLENQNAKVLFTGDIGSNVEDYLAEKYDIDIDVLKTAHHGSKFSSSEKFLNEASPAVSVVEVGKNSYGHPTTQALNRLTAIGSQIFRTDYDGAIKLEIQNNAINIFKLK
ncbi:MAG: hypothetical protein UT92_C0001G0034 [Candidatus Curtissbacteria bacterium GW2011_GWA1_40_24]|uniref:Metallo-beta-lactamase domain-containing protein n=2 Tax=Patescibacteria group TaxID=1783273 RepID=A0A0G0S0D6_9BACT|nr:MAG: hypothetical protein UT92_C0001G0034 [Candidatus Curtissbacteria bacterium GW2011_GWA1_40_24]KKR89031.1 MAG: hypothetical protein UU38_C0002G0034 [Candidatus Wolfebacteria bacterium GW2011_GWB1_41_12]